MCTYVYKTQKHLGYKAGSQIRLSLSTEGVLSEQKACLEAAIPYSKKGFNLLHQRTLWEQKPENRKELQLHNLVKMKEEISQAVPFQLQGG